MEEIQYCAWLLPVCATDGEWLGFWGGAVSAVFAFLGAIAFEQRLRAAKSGKTRRALANHLRELESALQPFIRSREEQRLGSPFGKDSPEQARAYRAASAARSIVRWGLVRPDRVTTEQWRELENLRIIFDRWDSTIEGQFGFLRQFGKIGNTLEMHHLCGEIIEQLRVTLATLEG